MSTRSTALSPLSSAAIRRLAGWYRRERRDLPWRRTRDPYAIWISEILAQQTQIVTVRPYYERFLAAFPTLEALARAPLARVLKVWEGCGYYARARNLHRAARMVVSRGGGMPSSAQELEELPGIGHYTAAAIASLAFGEPVAAIDSNVERVLARLLAERRVVRSPEVRRRLERAAEAIMHIALPLHIRPGDLNQAMIELGALVCIARRAACARCPLAGDCRARVTLSDVTILPRRTAAHRVPHYDIGAAVIRKRGRVLIAQRPLDSMLGGMWEFPGGKRHRGETLKECVAREIREELGIEIKVGRRIARVEHSYSHFEMALHAFECVQTGGRVRPIGVADYRWVRPEQLGDFAFPKADRLVIERVTLSR